MNEAGMIPNDIKELGRKCIKHWEEIHDFIKKGKKEKMQEIILTGELSPYEDNCSFCKKFGDSCTGCPLSKVGNRCVERGGTWFNFVNLVEVDNEYDICSIEKKNFDKAMKKARLMIEWIKYSIGDSNKEPKEK